MRKAVFLLISLTLAASMARAAVANRSESSVLLVNYMRYQVAQNVMAQAIALAEDEPEAVQDEVRQEAAWWLTGRNNVIKKELESVFGDNASEKFQQFWMNYEKSEADGDEGFLGTLTKETGISASDYASLRKAMLEDALKGDVSSSGALLGAIERWIKAVNDGELKIGTLKGWITGDVSLKKPKRKLSPLEAAEAEPPPFVPDEDNEDVNPLDSLRTLRAEKRKKALEDATAGMAQVAAERAAAEAEYAAKLQAAAQAEAENMKRHADRLSAAEKEAFEQRQKSFGNRLKNVVSATIGAATGAFTGGLGAKAGQEAVNAIWGPTSPAVAPPLPPGGGAAAQPPQPPAQP